MCFFRGFDRGEGLSSVGSSSNRCVLGARGARKKKDLERERMYKEMGCEGWGGLGVGKEMWKLGLTVC